MGVSLGEREGVIGANLIVESWSVFGARNGILTQKVGTWVLEG